MLRVGAVLVMLPLAVFSQDAGAVQGTVTNSATHLGLGGVEVTLWTQQAVHYNATTDDTGAWRITGMKPGRYYSRLEKSGFVEPLHEGPPEPPLPVGGGPALRLDKELVPLATVRGRVLTPEGKPLQDIEVGFSEFNTAKTDGDGQFTLRDERPGSYLLWAAPKPPATASQTGHREEIVRTFYPSAVDRTQAVPIVVRGGDDLSGFEIRLRTSPVYRVRGTVFDETGNPLRDANVRLLSRGNEKPLAGQMTVGSVTGSRFFFGSRGMGTEEANATTDARGAFEFASVVPGEWELRAEAEPKRDAGRNLSLSWSKPEPAVVTDHDLDDIRLRFPERFTLQATLDWGDAPAPKLDPRASVLLLLMPVDGAGATLPSIPVKSGDTLRFENVAAGRYRIVPMPGFPPGYYPAAVIVEGQDVLGKPVDLSAATPPVRLVFKPNAGTVRGTVEKGEGATVLFWPQSAVTIDLMRGVQAGPGGSFEIGTVAPGDYYLLAVDRQNVDSQPDAVIRSFAASATPVHVDEAGSPSVALSLTHLP